LNERVELTYELDWITELLKEAGLTTAKAVHPATTNLNGFLGYAVIEFSGGKDHECFRQASKLERAFYKKEKSKFYYDEENTLVGPYCWVAMDSDAYKVYRFRCYEQRENKSIPLKWINEDNFDWEDGEIDIYQLIYNGFRTLYPYY
jgi:hypothetical protein